MKELDKLIFRLNRGIAKRSHFIKIIKHPQLLVNSLIELNEVIGNDSIKESIVDQINHIIVSKQKALYNKKDDNIMLNTILSGCPGVGKTMIATILSKIWYSLGFLQGGHKKSHHPLPEIFKHHQNDDSGLILIFGFIFLIWVIGLTWNFYSNYGGMMTVILVIVLFLVIFAIFYYLNKTNDDIVIKNHDNKKRTVQERKCDDDFIKVVSREHCVAGFCGQTAIKTLKVLEESLGKVLFIDEAYSLVHSQEDQFGCEAVNTINLFLSQHPNDIIVILAGYEDMLAKTVFAVQPGFYRRFLWKFKMNGYTLNELFEIFKFKLNKEDWILDDEQKTRLLFDKYPDSFDEGQAGDVDKLLYFISIEHSKDYMNNDGQTNINKLTVSQIERGLLKLRGHSMSSQHKEEYENPMSDFLNMFRSCQNNKCKPKHKPTETTSCPVVEELSTMDDQMKLTEVLPF